MDVSLPEQLKAGLEGANAWIAFGLARSSIESLSSVALSAGVKRLVVTTTLASQDINQTVLPEFDAVTAAFQAAGASFTGIRHGDVIDGNEDHAYEIVNSTVPCLDSFIERGVLARVAAELLRVDVSANGQCGISSAGAFAEAYLNILRSSGLNRRQEVTKMYTGGLQRVARLTVQDYELKQKKEDERKEAAEKSKVLSIFSTQFVFIEMR